MRKINILMLALGMMLALSAVVASTAFAEETLLWLVMGEDIPATGVTIDIPNVRDLLVEDTEAGPLKQATNIECGGIGMGVLLPEGLDEQSSLTLEKCTAGSPKGACETLESVSPVNLPWLTELLEPSTVFEDDLYEGTGGNPGLKVECETALGKKTDTCTGKSSKMLLKEKVETEEVEAEFPESVGESERFSCTEGKEHSGLVTGLFRIVALLDNGTVSMPVELNR
jgi:hypothetical protein